MPQAPAAVHTRTCAPCWSWVSTHNSPARPDCGSWNHEAWHFQQVLEHQQAPGHKPWTTRMPHASSQERKPSSGQDKGMSQENCRQHTWATQPMNPCESSPFKLPGSTYAPPCCRYRTDLELLSLQNDHLKNILVYILGGTGLSEAFYKIILRFFNANMENIWPNTTSFLNPKVHSVDFSNST